MIVWKKYNLSKQTVIKNNTSVISFAKVIFYVTSPSYISKTRFTFLRNRFAFSAISINLCNQAFCHFLYRKNEVLFNLLTTCSWSFYSELDLFLLFCQSKWSWLFNRTMCNDFWMRRKWINNFAIWNLKLMY